MSNEFPEFVAGLRLQSDTRGYTGTIAWRGSQGHGVAARRLRGKK